MLNVSADPVTLSHLEYISCHIVQHTHHKLDHRKFNLILEHLSILK